MKITFDLFKSDQIPTKGFKKWVNGWWYRSEGIAFQKGGMSNGDEWLLVGFLLSDENINDIISKMRAEGIESLFKVDGQFILVIYLKAQDRIEIYRDRTGILPLVYSKLDHGLVFSICTENVVLLSGSKPSVSRNVFDQFPIFRIQMAPDSFIENIRSLSARCSLEVSNNTISTLEHPMIFPASQPFDSIKSASIRLGEDLSIAVKKRISSLKSVGAWLSGGNDSSLLVALAREHHSGDIKTVFITFADYEFNYGKYARDVANKFNTEHFEINISVKNYLNHWAETIKITNDPLPSPGSAIGQVVALKELALPVDAMLIGEGADTIFGGPYWAPLLFLSDFGNILPGFARKLICNLSSNIKGQRFLSNVIEKSTKALGTPLPDYLYSEIACGEEKSIDLIFGSGIWQKSAKLFKSKLTGNIFDSLFLYLMFDWLPAYNVSLRRLANHFGLLYLFPFVDYNLMQNSLRLPKHLRYHYFTKKACLKEYALKYFDKEFINKPKEGFGVPLGKWFAKPEFAQFLNLPLEERSLRRGWWRENDLKPIIDLHKSGHGTDKSAESIPWKTINLELWARICLEGDSPDLYKIS